MTDELQESSRKRLKTSHACDLCRHRKIRCDGAQPCATCSRAQESCNYSSEPSSRGKSDAILDSVLRVERMLQQVLSRPSTGTVGGPSPRSSNGGPAPSMTLPPISQQSSSASASNASPSFYQQEGVRQALDNFDNAVLESMHTSTTEAILQWPHFEPFPPLRSLAATNYELEQSRPPIECKHRPGHPFVSSQRVSRILTSFEKTVNFWFPTLSHKRLWSMRNGLLPEQRTTGDTETCLMLLTMALGCAAEVTQGMVDRAEFDEEERDDRHESKALADMFFESALQRLYAAHANITSTAAHCLLFAALYFAFLNRPLQAWEYVYASATKCLLLLKRSRLEDNAEDTERLRRIYWTCFVLESDYLAELSDLPQSGIAAIESRIPLPGAITEYSTCETSDDTEQACLYFLACISMRRLLNRVHHHLYAKDTGTAVNSSYFSSVVAELSHQLEEWRVVLPSTFQFTVGFECEPAGTEAGGFLRQRYLTCRSVIYRPYLMLALSCTGFHTDGELSYSDQDIDHDLLVNSGECLNACLLHILNLKGFGQTVFVDTWICSMSMAAAMLVLLAASRIPQLQRLMPEELAWAGSHIQRLLANWQEATGASSPSASKALYIINEAHALIVKSCSDGH